MAAPQRRVREPTPGALALAAVLAGLSAFWAAWQWRELVVARSGGIPLCLGGGESCARLWDTPLATALEASTGIPVAGWGVVWSLAALAMPLLARVRMRAGKPAEPFWSATVLAALCGLGSVLLLAGVGLQAGLFCSNCVITYALVAGYAAVAIHLARSAPPRRLAVGAPALAGALVLCFAAALVPGLRTPRAGAGSAAILEGGSGDLERRIAELPPQHRQFLSDARSLYLAADVAPRMHQPRRLLGSPMAPVRITHFSDFLCQHCATLHRELDRLLDMVPRDAVAIEGLTFPLDGSCNPYVAFVDQSPVRCMLARAMICLEGQDTWELEGALFESQATLNEDRIFELTEPYMPRSALEACMDSEATEARLQEDLRWAAELGIEGTPLVLVNGRKAPGYLPFLYAMAMTGGDPQDAVFSDLPPPRRDLP